MKKLSELFIAYRNEAYDNLPSWRVNELKKIYSSIVKDKKNGFVRGYFWSIERKISSYVRTEEQENSITDYIETEYPHLTQGRTRNITRSRAAFEAYHRGINEGNKVSLNSAIKNNAPRMNAIGRNL